MKTLNRKAYLNKAILLPIVLLVGCSKPVIEEVKDVVRPATLYTVNDHTSSFDQNFPALIKASNETELAFRVGGELIEVNVVAGSLVKKGDVIAKMDPTDFKVNVATAKAQFNLAEKTFLRFKRMLSLELTSQAQFDEAEAQKILAKVNLENAENNLAYTILRAPYDGKISSKNVQNHEAVKANNTAFVLHDEDGIDVSFQLPESILSRISQGSKSYRPAVIFTSSEILQDKEFRATFKEIDNQPDPRSRSYTVVLHMDKPEGVYLAPGMTANVKIELDHVISNIDKYSLVPIEAVFSPAETNPEDKQFAVWKVNQETMRVSKQLITVNGLSSKGMQVTTGLKPGDVIVAAGVNSLVDDTKVRAWIKERGI
ncbi:efflux RND transporter periplasmic adaptor subunit [Thalassotalea psychrophila]|uniref:Efflux RND transporter periplasmic adaptor subunit n=1 Tax=Thalassotalea psychrophila TaxID=3065647 RepID=A0ABY9TZ35_9GAMM|nr:efflux RND transporter periplasmic adaptor subunit [Colwelliaceae bacterium SQ149]